VVFGVREEEKEDSGKGGAFIVRTARYSGALGVDDSNPHVYSDHCLSGSKNLFISK